MTPAPIRAIPAETLEQLEQLETGARVRYRHAPATVLSVELDELLSGDLVVALELLFDDRPSAEHVLVGEANLASIELLPDPKIYETQEVQP